MVATELALWLRIPQQRLESQHFHRWGRVLGFAGNLCATDTAREGGNTHVRRVAPLERRVAGVVHADPTSARQDVAT